MTDQEVVIIEDCGCDKAKVEKPRVGDLIAICPVCGCARKALLAPK